MPLRRTKEQHPIIKKIAKRIKELRQSKGLKQRDVAHGADMDTENFRKYEKGTQDMRVSTLARIAESLEVDITELLK